MAEWQNGHYTNVANQLHIAMLSLATVNCTCIRGPWATINISKCIITVLLSSAAAQGQIQKKI